jgi:UDP-GlcNAc:undecaprenyl-phosphate GlcNAc-1-phosphate transferase
MSNIELKLLTTVTAASFLLGIFAVYLSHFLAKATNFHDSPDLVRKFHLAPTPSTGGVGIGIVLIFLGSILLMKWETFPETFRIFLTYLAPSLLVVFVTGIIDDSRGLSSKPKFILQFIAAGISSIGIIRVFESLSGQVLPEWLGLLLGIIAAFWIVSGCNAVNLADGIDGHAGTLGIIALVTLGITGITWEQNEVIWLVIPFSAILISFLLFNRPPASIFMGDTGSLMLGFTISSLMIYLGIHANGWYYFLGLPVMLGVPIMDTAMSIVRRVQRGVNPFESDSEHIHHMLQRYFQSPGLSVLVLSVLTTLFSITSLFLAGLSNKWVYLVTVSILFGLFMVILISYNKKVGQYLFYENVKIILDKKNNTSRDKESESNVFRLFKN